MIFKKTMLFWAALFCLSLPSGVMADSPAPNMEYTAKADNGQFHIQMIPENGWGGYGEGQGIAYEHLTGGGVKELWSVDFFSNQVYLSNDGKYLVAFGPWASDMSDLAVAFYADGKELKRYAVGDLIADESKLMKSVSHFLWRPLDISKAKAGFSLDQKQFLLRLIDETTCVFDIATGELLSQEL